MKKTGLYQVLRYFTPLAGIALCVILFTNFLHGTTHTTVVLTLLVVVLFCASFLGVGPGLTASISGALCYNFFFIPPVHTFNIMHPQDLVTFIVFTITALIVSSLSSAIGKRAVEAVQKEREVEKLYRLAKVLIETPDKPEGAVAIADRIVSIFGFDYCGIHVPDRNGRWKNVSLSSGYPHGLKLPKAGILQQTTMDDIVEEQGRQVHYTMLETPKGPVGMLATRTREISAGTVAAVASLIALALQRNRIVGKQIGFSRKKPASRRS
jgi:two-component system, OmpR family, sensor histidine kinase KdpD